MCVHKVFTCSATSLVSHDIYLAKEFKLLAQASSKPMPMRAFFSGTMVKQIFPFPITIQPTGLLFVIEHEEFMHDPPDSSAVSQTGWRACHLSVLLKGLKDPQLLHEACPIPAHRRLPFMDK